MRHSSAARTWRTWILIASALVCAAGCGRPRLTDPAYPAYRGVVTLSEARWAVVDGRLYLLEGTWEAEEELTVEDLNYNFKAGALLTPGFVGELLEGKP